MNEKLPFVNLITSSFPSQKVIDDLVKEQRDARLFDLFELKQDEETNDEEKWMCYLCSDPERINNLFDERPLIQGQLKEKHGKCKFFRRWHKRLFTLTDGSITYFKKDMVRFFLSLLKNE